MRQKTQNFLPGFFQDDDETIKIVQEYRNIFKAFHEYLTTKCPEIEQLAHNDLKGLCKPKASRKSSRSRTPDFTTQNLFRAILVRILGNLTWRGTTIAIAESRTLQNFCRLFDKETINPYLICQAAIHLSPETWRNINTLFGYHMIDAGKITPETVRVDGTVVETNIHYPTDSSLCWDAYRTIVRFFQKVCELGFGPYLPDFRFHLKKIKSLNFMINRFAKSKDKKRQRMVRAWYRAIINRTGEAVGKAVAIVAALLKIGDEQMTALATQLNEFVPWMEQIVSVARRRWGGEKVPNEEKVFSLFEWHTELIKKGKQSKPIEFGHLVWLSQTREKFILFCEACEISPPENTLLPVAIERQEELYGEKPKNVAADKGFHPGKDELEDLLDDYEGEVEFLGVPSRTDDFGDEEMKHAQRFRAGIEGTISFLKRSFGLSRCVFKGFRGFCRFVGGAVFCHNLLTMVRADLAAADG